MQVAPSIFLVFCAAVNILKKKILPKFNKCVIPSFSRLAVCHRSQVVSYFDFKTDVLCFFITEILPDAIASECGGCSDKQKEGSKKVFKFLIEKKPEQWKALEAKYDPSGSYKTKYDAKIKAL